MAEGQIFLSYSTRDKEVVDAIRAALGDLGLPTWVDERRIRPGDVLPTKIREPLHLLDFEDGVAGGRGFVGPFSTAQVVSIPVAALALLFLRHTRGPVGGARWAYIPSTAMPNSA